MSGFVNEYPAGTANVWLEGKPAAWQPTHWGEKRKITRQFFETLDRLSGSITALATPFRADALDLEADRKSTRLNSSHPSTSYAVFCLIGRASCRERV